VSDERRFAELLKSIGDEFLAAHPSNLLAAQRSAFTRAARRRWVLAFAGAVGAIALVVAVAVVAPSVGERFGDSEPPAGGPTQQVSPSPTPEETPSDGQIPPPNDCEEVPFSPTSVPLGLAGRLQTGSSAEPGEEPPNVRGHWPGPGPGIGVDLIGSDYAFAESPGNEKTIEVLGSPATLASDGDVYVVEFSFQECDWALAGNAVVRKDLRRMAESLIPSSRQQRSACRDKGVPFRPETVPSGWSSEPQPRRGRVLGVFEATPAETGSTVRVHISEDVVADPTAYEPVQVLGDDGRIGGWHEGTAVAFTFEGCNYTLLGSVDVRPEELRAFAESLQPTP
jgi:hypothetical protein